MRTLAVLALTIGALAALLAGWIRTGYHSVRAEQAALMAQPLAEARALAAAQASELTDQLETLRASESERPYYQYQNLFHDPRGAYVGASVTPSPLAERTGDPLIAGHFQIDAAGRVSVPPINEDVPALTNPAGLESNRVLLASVRARAPELAFPQAAQPSAAVAQVDPPPRKAAVKAAPNPEPQQQQQRASLPQQRQSFDYGSYTQNAQPNTVYQQVQSLDANKPKPRKKKAAPPSPKPPAPAAVEITTDPFEWRTIALDGAPRLVALRRVDTPDGTLTQGFVVDAPALEPIDDAPAPDGVVSATLPIDGDGWRISIDARPQLERAELASAEVARRFWRALLPVGGLALAAGALIVLLVARSERLSRQRAHFAAAAAHELRTPLAGLQLYGDMLADGLGDPARAGAYARRIADEAGRLGRVVGNVLGFTQLERGTLAVAPAAADAAVCLRDAVERARPALEHAGASLVLDLPTSALPARFDADALARIVQNLLDNAEKYTRGAADRRITVSARAGAAGRGVRIDIADRGPGIARAAARKLFRPFYRAVEGNDRPAGLGLGLSLARSLARAQGGDLVYRPVPDGGACFTLTLT